MAKKKSKRPICPKLAAYYADSPSGMLIEDYRRGWVSQITINPDGTRTVMEPSQEQLAARAAFRRGDRT